MNFKAAVGSAQALDGREAAISATHQALRQLEGAGQAALGLIFAAQEFDLNAVLNGVSGLLRNTPLWGISTVQPFTGNGTSPRSVVVALLRCEDLKTQTLWIPDSSVDSKSVTCDLLDRLKAENAPQTVWVGGDGVGADISTVLNSLGALKELQFVGGLASGNYTSGKTLQICGNQVVTGGCALAFMNASLHIGVGMAHGWQPVGRYFPVSRVNSYWVRSLGSQTPAEVYSEVYGCLPHDWTVPPLADLLRLYPLEIEQDGVVDRIIRSPIRVEADGSFRFNIPIPQNSTAHLLTGSIETCLQAVHNAVDSARAALSPARPALAVVFADLAWKLMFEAHPGGEIEALSQALDGIPLAGAYTLGQIGGAPPHLFNQHIQVVLLGVE